MKIQVEEEILQQIYDSLKQYGYYRDEVHIIANNTREEEKGTKMLFNLGVLYGELNDDYIQANMLMEQIKNLNKNIL